MTSISAGKMIEFAYDVSADRLDKSEWLYKTLYDVTAVTSLPATKKQMRLMLQDLLAERFHLKLRHEARVTAVYDLTAGKELKLQAAKIADDALEPGFSPRLVSHEDGSSETLWAADGVSLGDLAKWLSSQMTRPVVDRSALSGKFDIKLTVGHTEQAAADGHNMFSMEDHDYISALQTQLGLQVERAKAMVETLVIDQIVAPDEN